MIPHRLLTSLASLTAGGCCLALVAARSHKADVPLEQVPRVVIAAAEKAVDGITLAEAKLRTKKSGVVFKLEGTAGDRGYEIKVDAAGKVLDVERDDSAGGGGKKRRQHAPAVEAALIGETFPDSPAVRVGFIRHAAVRESSGIVASRNQPGVFWTHNDKGNPPYLYAIRRDGTLLAAYHVSATHDDWEDVAVDGEGNLYVGNIGNNNAERNWLEVHRLPEPRIENAAGDPGASHSLKAGRTWRLRFPARPFDCEALFVHGGHGFVISKHADGTPASLYRFPLEGADAVTLERVAELPVRAAVTAADLSPDGSTLAVLTYDGLYTFAPGGDTATAGQVRPRRVTLPAGKVEGACLTAGGIVVTSEGRDVYHVPNPQGH